MSPFKKSTMKGDCSKGKETMIDLDSFSPKSKKTRSSTRLYDANKFKSYTAYQAYVNYFKDAPMLVESVVEKASFLNMNIPNGLPPRIGTIFYPTLKICTKSL